MSKGPIITVTIKDCRVDTFTVGGHGGAGKDTSNTGVRITHDPSGAVGVGTETRSQLKNKQAAFRRMAESPKFQLWAKRETLKIKGHITPEQKVNLMMAPENIKEEVIDVNGEWIETCRFLQNTGIKNSD